MSVSRYFYDSESGARSWNACEANNLIEIFESHYYLFGVMPSNEDVWILMASALQRRGIDVTARQVRRKWIRMRKTFANISSAKTTQIVNLCQHLRCKEDQKDYYYDIFKKSKKTNNAASPLNPSYNYNKNVDMNFENLKNMYDWSWKLV